MDAIRYARVKELFDQALALGPAERAVFLSRACENDATLGREVAELLAHHQAAPRFLTALPRAQAAPPEQPMPKLKVPGFTLERELGRGSMGVVYLAEQERPRRAVALKFLRLDSMGPAGVKRFEREAEILGQLSHRGIAHMYGVGLVESEQGELPWIAMEYVRGESLHEYVERRRPALHELVELFANLCDAVQHAHQKGIVHRDLKPSNVLVDEEGDVRVLDFGVARLIEGGAAVDSAACEAPHTRTGQIVGTLAYASPEQAAGRANAVNARSDVYALGVMLHELLTGDLPYEIDELKIVDAVHTICDQVPKRLRGMRRDAPADLEKVLLMALAKEPERRYANAGELAADLRRFLAERPVTAQAPTTLYQASKFVRRNRALAAGGASVILGLLVTVGALLVSRHHDREQFERTRSMLDLMSDQVFQLVPELGFGQDHRDMLEALDARLADELALEPGDAVLRGYRARSMYELGALDETAGDLAAADRRFEQAHVLREGLVAEDPADLESRTHLSQIYARLGEVARLRDDPTGELAWFQRAFELDRALVAEHPGDGELVEDLGWSLERMTALALRREDWAEAQRYASWRLADATRLVEQDRDNWKFLNNAAQAHKLASAVAEHLAPGEVEGHKHEVLRLVRRLHELQPRRADFQFLWANANFDLALQLKTVRRDEDALPYAEVALGQALQLLSGEPRSERYGEFVRCAADALFLLQVELGRSAQAETTLTRLRVGANIAGEGSPNALLLLLQAELRAADMQTTEAGALAARERVLDRYQALFLSPEASPDLIERTAEHMGADDVGLSSELCRRLLLIDEPLGRKMAALLAVGPNSFPGLAPDLSVEDR